MSKLRNFINKIAKNATVFTAEDVGAMSKTDFDTNHDAIMYQMNTIGLPRRANLAGNPDVIYVEAYTRKDGTPVRGYYRSVSGGAANIEDFDADDYENTVLQGSVEYDDYLDELPFGIPNTEVVEPSKISPAQPDTPSADYFSDDMNISSVMYNDYLYNQLLHNPIDDLLTKYTNENTDANISLSNLPDLLGNVKNFSKEVFNDLTRNPKETFIWAHMGAVSQIPPLMDIINKKYPLAEANFSNYLHDFARAKQNPNADILESRQYLKDKELNAFMDTLEIPENSKGVVYNSQSLESKQLWNSNEIQSVVKNYENELKVNNNSGIFDIEFKLRNNFDNFAGIQHCKLYNPHITKDGYFEGKIIDYYDFAYRDSKTTMDAVNNFGYITQKYRLGKNYFNIYEIRGKIK